MTEKDISLLSYNIHDFNGNYWKPYEELDSKIVDFVIEQKPDIICFQEYSWTRTSIKKMQVYPYEFLFYLRGSKRYAPMSIFSKYPIVSKGSLDFPNTANNAIFADILVKDDTLRVYNAHLQSLRFMPGSIKSESPIRIFKRLGNTIKQQKTQVERIYEHADKSPYPYIISGDLNNTQYSTVYRRLKRGMKDTYMERGNGLGTTLLFKFLPFRIDYILVDPQFEVVEHKNFDVEYSDHYPVKASFRFRDR